MDDELLLSFSGSKKFSWKVLYSAQKKQFDRIILSDLKMMDIKGKNTNLR